MISLAFYPDRPARERSRDLTGRSRPAQVPVGIGSPIRLCHIASLMRWPHFGQ